jgi:small subunit ribosomal protein S15
VALLHTSAALSASHASGQTKKANQRRTAQRERDAAANKPHVVLGTRPGEEWKWEQCDLAKCLVGTDALAAEAVGSTVTVPGSGDGTPATVNLPPAYAYGVATEAQTLFGALPTLSAETRANAAADRTVMMPEQLEKMHADAHAKELRKAEVLARIVDLRNANASGIAYENRRRCVEMFSKPGKPDDTGCTEVQGMSACFSCLECNSRIVFSGYYDDADPQPLVPPDTA